MREPRDLFAGDKGFGNLSTSRLAQRLGDYKRLRDHDQTPTAMRDYARQAVREIRDELQRRSGQAVAA